MGIFEKDVMQDNDLFIDNGSIQVYTNLDIVEDERSIESIMHYADEIRKSIMRDRKMSSHNMCNHIFINLD